MTVNLHRRIWRISMGSAIVLSAPVVLLSAWCAWNAYANLDLYSRVAYPSRGISLDDFRLSFHDMLTQWSRNLFSWNDSGKSNLPKFKLHLKNAQLQAVLSDHSGKGKYVEGIWSKGNRNIHIRVRQRGHKHWHHMGAKHSMKVRFGKDGGGLGLKALALINEPTPFFITNVLIAEVAKNFGLLFPEPDFVRVWLNGADMGVYRRQIMADEALLRRNNRYPCNLYSGDLDGDEPAQTLWTKPTAWKKSAWCSGGKKSYIDLASFLDHISSDSFQEFSDFAHNKLDMKSFATLDALEIAFGIAQRDWRQGHKLVHEIGSGKWEPVAWSLRGFFDTGNFKPSNSPLGIRLEMVPGYLSMRNRILHQMLIGPARPTEVRNRALELFSKLIAELTTDAHWDAYELTPDTDPFLYKMLRPMNEKKLSLVFDSEMASYAIRHAHLLSELENVIITTTACRNGKKSSWPFRVTILSRVGVSLESIGLWFEDKQQHPWVLKAAGKRIHSSPENSFTNIPTPIDLFPSVELVKHQNPKNKNNPLTTQPTTVSYGMEIQTDSVPLKAILKCRNLATGSIVVLNVDFSQPKISCSHGEQEHLDSSLVPSFTAGQHSAHPWSYDRKESKKEISFGPGDVPITHTMTFGENQKVTVLPGTRFIMDKDASLVFLGQVQILGTRKKPVLMEPAGKFSYGGLVLQGDHAAGSRVKWLHTRGGSYPVLFGQKLQGTISINNTKNILMENCKFEKNSQGIDLVHASNVSGFRLQHVTINRSSQDALDLEFCRADIRDLIVLEPKDEAIDLMGSTVEISDSILSSAGGSDISAGERSRVTIERSILNRGKTGILIKHGSSVVFFSSLITKCNTGIKVKAASRYYPNGSSLDARSIAIVDCGTNIIKEERSSSKKSARTNLSNILYSFGHTPFIEHIRKDILGVPKWSYLDRAIEKLALGVNLP